jgi:hypothetical protein
MKTMAKKLDHLDTHWDNGKNYGAEDAMDQGPVVPGSENYQEHFDGGKTRHKGGVHDGYRDTGLADNRRDGGDFIGDASADEMSRAGADSLRHLGIMPDEQRHNYRPERDAEQDDEQLEADLPARRRGRR